MKKYERPVVKKGVKKLGRNEESVNGGACLYLCRFDNCGLPVHVKICLFICDANTMGRMPYDKFRKQFF